MQAGDLPKLAAADRSDELNGPSCRNAAGIWTASIFHRHRRMVTGLEMQRNKKFPIFGSFSSDVADGRKAGRLDPIIRWTLSA
jgi:hypothetical protein